MGKVELTMDENETYEIIKILVLDLYRNNYWDANFEHFQELLAKHEDIHISTNALPKILMDASVHHWFGSDKTHLHLAINKHSWGLFYF